MAANNSSRKQTARKTTSQRSRSGSTKTSSARGKKASLDTNGNGLGDEVVLLLIMAFSILVLLSNFHLVGAFGEFVSDVMFGVFGVMAYVAPFLLFLGACFLIANRGNNVANIKLWGIALLFLTLCTTFQMIYLKEFGDKGLGYYTYSKNTHHGGGVLGGAIAGFLHNAIGSVGTCLILIVLLIICFIMITEKSFLTGVRAGSEKVYHTAKEDSIRRQRLREERMRQRELEEEAEEPGEEEKLRMNRKVSGVALDTSITAPEPEQTDDIHEITHEITIDNLEEDFDFEKINIKMADKFAEEAKLEPEYELPNPEEIRQDMQEEVIIPAETTGIRIRSEAMESFESRPREEIQAVEELLPETEAAVDERPKAVRKQTTHLSDTELDISEDLSQSAVLKPKKEYVFPPVRLLKRGTNTKNADSQKELRETAAKLKQTLDTFGVKVTITEISQGPTVTRYEMQPEMGVKVSKIVGLSDDIKLNLAATDIRIEAPIPGKAAIGIEIPNKDNSTVMFRDLIENDKFTGFPSKLAFAVGKDISGQVVVADIAKMPHLLIAGATGSGKSVCINTLIMSILYKAHPDDVKMIMIDPKVVELSIYNGIPHLMIPVVSDPKKAAAALHWGVAEMTERYKKFADLNVRDLKGYNKKIEGMQPAEGEPPLKKLPQIVIIVDELADLMMVSPGEVEESICRLAQLARACGIHLIIATQRPSVDVITGLIKANMPSRVAFSVSSGVDSRTILDMNGAEKLLGKGDMLFYPQGYTKPARIQGAFISDNEVQDVVEFLTKQTDGPAYSSEVEEQIATAGSAASGSGGADGGNERDQYFVEAARFIIDKDKASIGMLQRVFKIGFNRAARIMDQLADAGVVGEEEGTKPRKVLMSPEQFDQYIEEYL